jgi:L-amino acid N-acyltransferase YncA/protein-tyrosine-phosphatase
MAEGLLRALGGDRFDAFSAGTEATHVRPLAIQAMAELSIDIAGHQSKTLERYLDQPFDMVITVCDRANETCPVFFGARERRHWSFPDPSKAIGSEEEQLAVYRQVRDAIRERIADELLMRPHVRPATLSEKGEARRARRADAAAIAHIYNQGIEDRIATFETEPRTTGDIERLLDDRLGRYPAIVVERVGQVVAWAGAGTYRARPCYDPIVEHSVYVDRGHRGSGVGRIALEALCAEAERLGFLKLVSRIFPENVASLALHRKVGFREVGTYRRHGKLDGQWRDCVIVEKLLGDAAKAEGQQLGQD